MTQAPFGQVALMLSADDNVAVLRRQLRRGDMVQSGSLCLTASTDVPEGHKIAVRTIPDRAPVMKYGQIIGVARGEIACGDHVHTHNLALPTRSPRHESGIGVRPLEPCREGSLPVFRGYPRPNGLVGTRNYIAIIPSVNCSASVCAQVRARFPAQDLSRDFPKVDGVLALTHKSGCAIDPGEPLELLRRVLAGFARHPNISGCVFVGLGCETNQLEALRREYRLENEAGNAVPLFLNIQTAGGHRKTVEAAVQGAVRLMAAANTLQRVPQPVSNLVLAENCGGSDAFSGITANPALGCASDQLVRCGGTSVLAETPEIYGAEHLLAQRAATPEVAEKLLQRIEWWKAYASRHNSVIDNNPSPGNKAGGLTNIIEKSLGAIAKAGRAPLMEVFQYAEPVRCAGLCFMDTPGYDPVSMTGLVAGGCNIGVFTTGRGSVYGCKPAPCIKVSSNTALYDRMPDDMDLNAGTILDGTETIEQVGNRIFEKIIAVASGEKTKSELAGSGDEEFAPWLLGPTF